MRVAATSVNPIDTKRRAGLTQDFYPLKFRGFLGRSLGNRCRSWPRSAGFSPGDQVFGMADQTYAELCVVNASSLAKIPPGLDLVDAAALPLVTTTGNQLISVGTGIKAGQTVLVTGAAGNVGRSAVFTAKDRGARVTAGVLKKQLHQAADIGADQVIATDDDTAMVNLPLFDAIADTVDGKTAEKLLAKVKPGGVFASVLGAPRNASEFPAVKVVPVYATPAPTILLYMAQ